MRAETKVVMRTSAKPNELPPFLSGWKDIANYLGKGVRTVQRYEYELGLPVRRPAGKMVGSVVATKAELDAWVSASPMRAAFHLAKPAPGPPQATAAGIQNGIEEMKRLRDQMAALRLDLRSAVQLLREGIEVLRGGLTRNQWRDVAASDRDHQISVPH